MGRLPRPCVPSPQQSGGRRRGVGTQPRKRGEWTDARRATATHVVADVSLGPVLTERLVAVAATGGLRQSARLTAWRTEAPPRQGWQLGAGCGRDQLRRRMPPIRRQGTAATACRSGRRSASSALLRGRGTPTRRHPLPQAQLAASAPSGGGVPRRCLPRSATGCLPAVPHRPRRPPRSRPAGSLPPRGGGRARRPREGMLASEHTPSTLSTSPPPSPSRSPNCQTGGQPRGARLRRARSRRAHPRWGAP